MQMNTKLDTERNEKKEINNPLNKLGQTFVHLNPLLIKQTCFPLKFFFSVSLYNVKLVCSYNLLLHF